jgi:hypothetical protein
MFFFIEKPTKIPVFSLQKNHFNVKFQFRPIQNNFHSFSLYIYIKTAEKSNLITLLSSFPKIHKKKRDFSIYLIKPYSRFNIILILLLPGLPIYSVVSSSQI